MLIIDQACPEDITYIAKISESVFSKDIVSAPDGFDNPEWYFNISDTGYLYKIIFNGELAGAFVAFRTGHLNFQLERIFILPEYQNLGIGKKAVYYALKRFPEAKVWYTDVKPSWDRYSLFLKRCGFFESGFITNSSTRYIKLLK
ncbi:MAG: GNAT family N-acetyltransferase [Clostridiales bacterium]|nr:GNAT family N-acetyltransferase [Clostridiales bacterium]